MDYSSILMLVILVAVFYFLMIRPESKRKKAAENMRNSLKKGDQITTIGGIVAKIVTVNESTLIIETSEDRVRMEITKWAISSNGVQTGVEPTKAKKEKTEAVEEETVDAAQTAKIAESAEVSEEKKD